MNAARRRAGVFWVFAGLLLLALSFMTGGPAPGAVTIALVTLTVALALATLSSARRIRAVLVTLMSVALALDFAGAVADRFGAFGAPGKPGVSWGSWSAFVDYTAQLLPNLPHSLVVAAAVTATAAEICLACLLLTGRQRRWVGKATAGLFIAYLASMSLSLGWHSAQEYAVPVLIGAALLISSKLTAPASVDVGQSPTYAAKCSPVNVDRAATS